MFALRYMGSVIYDLLALLVIFLAITAIILLCRNGTAIPQGALWYRALLLLCAFSYYYYSLNLGGQTLGMRAWRLKLVSTSAKQLSAKQIVQRLSFAVAALPLAPFYAKKGYILNSWSKTAWQSVDKKD